jgi:hypothetical protein
MGSLAAEAADECGNCMSERTLSMQYFFYNLKNIKTYLKFIVSINRYFNEDKFPHVMKTVDIDQ